MNKKAIFLSSLAAVALAAPLATADPSGGGSRHFSGAPARGAPAMARGAGTFNHWNGNRWSGNWRHRGDRDFDRDRDFHNRFVFFGGFGFPYYGYPYYGYYPYDYYGYGYYPYGYSAPYGYDYGYYSGSAYGHNYGDRNRGGSSVVALQRQLARAGYYRGAIDGIMGPATRRAMRAYERDHNQSAYGMTDRY